MYTEHAPPSHGGRATLELALAQFDAAAAHAGLEAGVRRIIRSPRRELTVSFPVQMRNGELAMFTGYRVHHNIVRGPAAGGIRYHPDLDLDTVRALAMWTTWRAALLHLPFGGAYGGVICDPTALNLQELEHLTRRFTTEIAILIGPDRDIPSPDRSTDAQVMAWMMDTYSMHQGYSVPAVVTGKPLAIGGSQGWATASGRGATTLCRLLAASLDLPLAGARVAVQGCGPIGATAAAQLARSGSRVVAIADGQAGVFRHAGLDVDAVIRFFDEHQSLRECPHGERLDDGALAGVSCDILLLSGFERIDAEAARAVQARLIVEGAYGALLPEADAVLAARGIPVLPAVLGGSGGAVASYFEWVQDLQEIFWSEDDINVRLDELLGRTFAEVQARAASEGVGLRVAADALAIERVAEAHRLRGLFP